MSPDGRTLVISQSNGSVRVYPLNGGQRTTCCQLAPGERLIRWNADGRSLITRRDNGIRTTILKLDLATGRRTQLWELAPVDPAGVSGPRPIAVTPDGRGYAYTFMRTVSDLYVVDGLK